MTTPTTVGVKQSTSPDRQIDSIVVINEDGATVVRQRVAVDGTVDLGASTLGALFGQQSTTWTQLGEATNAEVVVTRAGVAGQAHRISGYVVGFNSVATGVSLQIESPTGTPILSTFVHNQSMANFSAVMVCPIGAAVTLRLAAAGANVIGRAALRGSTG